jgi:hypothetical protein
MNIGVQDSVNLGWKLAQVVKGISPVSLLDTYQAERQPVGAQPCLRTPDDVGSRPANDRRELAGRVRLLHRHAERLHASLDRAQVNHVDREADLRGPAGGNPGAFCSPPGARGVTVLGTPMVCKLDSKGLRYRLGNA